MSERAQALEAALRELATDLERIVWEVSTRDGDATARQHLRAEAVRWALDRLSAAAPPVGVSPQPDLHAAIMNLRCDYVGLQPSPHRAGYREGFRDARHAAAELVAASFAPVEPTPEPTPDAQVCVWRDDTYGYRLPVCPESSAVTRWTLASNMKEWKVCPYCGKRLEVGTAPQGGEQ